MRLRRFIAEILWPPSSFIIKPWLPFKTRVLVKTNQTSLSSIGLRRLITKFRWPPLSSVIRSTPSHHNIALSRDIHIYAKFQHNRKPGNGLHLTCKISLQTDRVGTSDRKQNWERSRSKQKWWEFVKLNWYAAQNLEQTFLNLHRGEQVVTNLKKKLIIESVEYYDRPTGVQLTDATLKKLKGVSPLSSATHKLPAHDRMVFRKSVEAERTPSRFRCPPERKVSERVGIDVPHL
ncbi:hypothetical protein EVAR_82409_1 [Eumeta japonica]|uniref:Uncharacterized protein n=1 Tax=Eumeta variegata TaxID=151549 RepID=A0A4C1UBE0_EUMVA|nr:hypothetical protein EVAR_82409_1 [Eumeta japonica]